MMRQIFRVFFLIAVCHVAAAQPVSTLVRQAKREYRAGRVMAAAELWERAGRLKNSDPKLLHEAAQAFAQVRDYLRAADGYKVAAGDKNFPLAGLHYARALKQQGRYEEAVKILEEFAATYNGEHKAVLMAVTENEVSGCQLPLQYIENQTVRRLPETVNTRENEFAPIPFSENLLYFSRAAESRCILMRTLKNAEDWDAVSEASLPAEVAGKFRSACFSSDGSRFYYAQCEEGCTAQRGGSTQPGNCALYCLRRTESGWGEAERLPEYINLAGSSNLYPCAATANGVEYLFFSSDRAGGQGGLDVYVSQRPADSDSNDFSFPQNLGRAVNTGADEVSPHFDAYSQELWFSSMGYPSFGGLDIFKTEKTEYGWSKPQNLGQPLNSPADDAFFVKKKNGQGAFFSSNRSTGEAKPTTLDDDIFEWTEH